MPSLEKTSASRPSSTRPSMMWTRSTPPRAARAACSSLDSIGGKLTQYAESQARAGGAAVLFCLSTQAFNFFQQKGGFVAGTPDDLPASRRERYDRSGRHSLVLRKKLV